MIQGIHNFLDCSIGHLPKEDAQRLETLKYANDIPWRTIQHEFGWFIWMPDNESLETVIQNLKIDHEFSSAIGNILRYAAQNDCWIVNLDRDAKKIDKLKCFEWE